MSTYVLVVLAVVVISSTALFYILRRNHLLNLSLVLSISTASILISIIFPFVLGTFINYSVNRFNIIWAFLIIVLVYITLVLLLTVLIASMITEETEKRINQFFRGIPGRIHAFRQKQSGLGSDDGINADACLETAAAEDSSTGNNLTDDSSRDELQQAQNNSEKFIDSSINTGTMGIENIVENSEIVGKNSTDEHTYQDDTEAHEIEVEDPEREDEGLISEEHSGEGLIIGQEAVNDDTEAVSTAAAYEDNSSAESDTGPIDMNQAAETDAVEALDLEGLIDEAFRLKQNGDLEGSILHYMYALDRVPGKDLAFWIILDICVLYKSLGQTELARDVLESCIATYGDVMDAAVRAEIESNL